MKLVISPFNNCHKNIATEEYLVNHIEDNIFLLYINAPSIIIGKNQNTYAEINHDFIEKHNINVVRRRSGGGAVYHDEGNLNFCFIMNKSSKDINALFKDFTRPIILALKDLGVCAEFTGRNDLTIEGKKFSGNAQWHANNRSVIHGTLLFNSDLTVLSKALQANEMKFIGKAVKSIRSRVTNIKPYLDEGFEMHTFIEKIISKVESLFEQFEKYEYTQEDTQAIERLAKEKYATRKWTYGESPNFEYVHRFKYEKGSVEVNANFKEGKLFNTKLYGDFFGVNPNVSDLEVALSNVEYEKNAMLKALSHLKVEDYIDGLEADALVNAYFSIEDNQA